MALAGGDDHAADGLADVGRATGVHPVDVVREVRPLLQHGAAVELRADATLAVGPVAGGAVGVCSRPAPTVDRAVGAALAPVPEGAQVDDGPERQGSEHRHDPQRGLDPGRAGARVAAAASGRRPRCGAWPAPVAPPAAASGRGAADARTGAAARGVSAVTAAASSVAGLALAAQGGPPLLRAAQQVLRDLGHEASSGSRDGLRATVGRPGPPTTKPRPVTADPTRPMCRVRGQPVLDHSPWPQRRGRRPPLGL